MSFSAFDIQCMRRALHVAGFGLYSTGSNPRVGCVIVSEGMVVAEGWHIADGDEHAESMALRKVAQSGCHAYVTLEPCNHSGRQPPCTESLIRAKVHRVVIAMRDPNKQVTGGGVDRLRQAGITVETGLLEREAKMLNPGFCKRMQTSLPWLRMKTAMTLDGNIAAADGSSKWITSPHARADGMHWRGRAQALVTGRNTVERDNPQMNARNLPGAVNQPQVFVLDSNSRLSHARVLERGAVIVHCNKNGKRDNQHMYIQASNGKVDLAAFVRWLGEKGYNEVHVEAGALLSGALLSANFVDELVVYQSPSLLGNGRTAFTLNLSHISEAIRLQLVEERKIGVDTRLRFLSRDACALLN